ncbi:hypothetical protein [Oleidesulfovibrio sp.]|uniref:hypothetical protein n=1 Tax=Oleidesulfovibrio sp. TaxID=2909707 RepID=UPI003A88F503
MMRNLAEELIRYVQAAPFPHLTSIKVTLLALITGAEAKALMAHARSVSSMTEPHLGSWQWLLTWGPAWILAILAALFLWGVVLCQADAFSRFREFKRLRAMLARYGYNPRLLRPVSSSRCQRDAAMLAARETGYGAQAMRYFKECGYRWYHILPDAIVRNPLFFFHPAFLKATFIPGKTARKAAAASHNSTSE